MLSCLRFIKYKSPTLNSEYFTLIIALASYYFIVNCYASLTNRQLLEGIAGPIIGYISGWKLIECTNEKEYILEKVIKVIITGSSVFAMLCIFKKSMSMLTFTSHFNISGIYEGMRSRYVLNFWNGNLYHPTNFNSLLVFTAASIPYFVKKNKTAIERVWLILVATIMLIAALSTSTRTNLFVLIVVFFSHAF